MSSRRIVKCAAVVVGLLVMLATGYAQEVKYFADDSLRGTLSPNNPPSQAMFFSGKHNRTYVAYISDEFFAKVACYDHDTKRWIGPVQVDDCRFNDGHNTPEILITRDGYIHLFYGCHGNPVKYARSLYPEDITRWRLGREIGSRATYPNPVQLANGDILLFYRYGKGGWHRPLKVHRSTDNARTWDEGTEIVEFRISPVHRNYSGACYISGIFYDAIKNRFYLALSELVRDTPERLSGELHPLSTPYSVQYDPASRHLIGMNGVDLGTKAIKEELDANNCQVLGKFVRLPDGSVLHIESGAIGRHNMYSPDGVNIYSFGSGGGNVLVWKSSDSGQSWDGGQVMVAEADLDGDRPHTTALVRNYSGTGPIVIFQGSGQHASPEFIRRYEARQKYHIEPIRLAHKSIAWFCNWATWNNYNSPGRVGKRLYALDRDYQLVTSRGDEGQ